MENLNKLTKLLGADRIMTAEDVQQILLGIMEILKSYKEGTESINEETKQVVNSLLEHTVKYNQETISDFKSEAEKAHAERMKELQTFLSEVKTTLGDMEVMMSEVKDGADADEEKVIEEVINRIKIDPTVVTMSAEEVRDKIASLKDEDRLDKSAIKGLEKVLQQKDLDYAVATLQQQTSFLINKGGLKTVSHDATLSGDGTPENPLKVESTSGLTLETNGTPNGDQTLLNLVAGTNMTITDDGSGNITFDATGGSGSPGGTTTQLQYNNAGSFGGITGATTDGTAVTYTTGNLKATDVKASGSGGLSVLSNAGTQTALFGAGGGANNTFYGSIKADYATATTVPYFDASKNLISSAVTPTELGYLSGVTSAIQTQLNAKQATITGAATTITSSDLTASRALISNASGKVAVSAVTDTELGYVSGVTSSIQTQLNAKGTGSVTSVDVSGGTTGLTFTGGPITTSGTITAAGTLAVANGGTGQTTYTNGQLLIGNTTGNTLTKATLTGTANQVVVTNGGGSITLSTPQDIGTSSNPQFATIELGNASDTTLSRSAAGTLAVEGVDVLTTSNTKTVTNKTIQAPLIDYVIEPTSDDTYEGEATNDINAGDTIAQWDLVYLDSTSGRWEFADADAASTSGGVLLALAAASGTDGNPMNVVFRGVVRNDGWTWSGAGKALYVSTTAGGMTETAPSGASDVIRVVGYTLSDDAIYFNPDNAWVVHT
jgi:hypothetical protein